MIDLIFKSLRKSPAYAGFFIFGCLSAAQLVACTSRTQEVSNQTIVQVNDDKLSAKIFSDQLARDLRQFDALAAKDPNNVKRVKEALIKKFILRGLTKDWAEKNKLSVTDDALEKEISKIRASYPDEMAFRRVLAQENMSSNDWKEEVRFTLLEKIVFKKVSEKLAPITDDEAKKYYEAHKEQYKRKERVYLRQIVLDQQANADRIKAELKDKKFEDLAKKFSIAPEAKESGLVGWVEKGTVEVFDKAFELPIGGISNVLESPYGFHLFKVEKKAPAGYASYDEVKDGIKRTLMSAKEQAEFSKWLDTEVRSVKVLRNNDLINSITVETRND